MASIAPANPAISALVLGAIQKYDLPTTPLTKIAQATTMPLHPGQGVPGLGTQPLTPTASVPVQPVAQTPTASAPAQLKAAATAPAPNESVLRAALLSPGGLTASGLLQGIQSAEVVPAAPAPRVSTVQSGNRTTASGVNVHTNTTTGKVVPYRLDTSGPPPTTPEVTAAASKIAQGNGWNQAEQNAWGLVINRESGGRMDAQNPTSDAYGIAQFINGPSEYAQYGGDVNTLQGQLTAMANYIKQRYGTPANAWAHELSAGWY